MIVYPKCSELVIQYVAVNIKPLCMTTAQFRDYFDVWDEQLEYYYHERQKDVHGRDVNLVAFFASWCEDMYSDGLGGLKVLYDAEQYERPRVGSQFAFGVTYGKRQYDMTFAVRVVRRMFLRVRPDLQASIAGLKDRDLLQKMEDSIGGEAAMANSPDRLSSLLTQLQALNSSDLRLLPETPEQRQHRQWLDRREVLELREQKAQQAFRAWRPNFINSNSELHRMNKVTHHSRKCVMDLQSDGTWFAQVWLYLSDAERDAFVSYIEGRLGLQEGDFRVDVKTPSECPVIFYLASVLKPLILSCFKPLPVGPPTIPNNQHTESWHQDQAFAQAFAVLHSGFAQKGASQAFVVAAYDR